jgi:hypothetical protein
MFVLLLEFSHSTRFTPQDDNSKYGTVVMHGAWRHQAMKMLFGSAKV